MKRIRRSKAARVLSWLLTLAMIMPIFSSIFESRPAMAQQPTETTGSLPAVIISEFANKSRLGGNTLARFASDAIATELANSGRFTVTDRKEVMNHAVKDLGFTPPFDNPSLMKIASDLGANFYLTGEVSFVKIDNKRMPKTVEVGLRVFMREASSGDLINGAAQTAIAEARPGDSDDLALANEAANKAAILCVKQILAYNLPEGIVLSSVGSGNDVQIIINRGSRDGIQTGMQMVVVRNHQPVGKIGITKVNPADSEARIIQNTLGIAPEDRVRAIFPEPVFNQSSGTVANVGRRTSDTALKSLGTLAVVVLLGVLIAATVQGGKNTTVTGVVAEAEIFNGAPGVRIVWRDNLFGSNTLEYHIWRSPDDPYNYGSTPIASMGSVSASSYNDQPSPYSFWDAIKGFQLPPLPSAPGVATLKTPAAGAVLGFTTGHSYNYQITSLIQSTTTTGTTNGNGTGTGTGTTTGTSTTVDSESAAVTSGQVTPINQCVLTTPQNNSTNVDLRNFNPTWLSVSGADQFEIEVSMDRNFSSPTNIFQFPIVFSSSPSADGIQQILVSPVDLTTNPILLKNPVFANFVKPVSGATPPTLFWRVGGRNSGDVPGPQEWFTKDPHSSNKNYRWIYSPVYSFTPAQIPPHQP